MKKVYIEKLIRMGARVKQLREAKKMTQQSLADKCEVDIRTIQRLEAGEFSTNLHIFFALCESLDVNSEELMKI